jgi:uncharacterized protein with NRDE domain
MCLIACAFRAHPDYELILAGNRDEFHGRPTADAAVWNDAPQVIGGRDLEAGGSWLALSSRGRLAAVTNVRRMAQSLPSAPSRGALVADFVRGDASAVDAAHALLRDANDYAGFNLLLWDGHTLEYVSNRPVPRHDTLPPGVYGLSNDALDTPWPKLIRLRDAMTAVVAQRRNVDTLFDALADDRPAADAALPDTGVGNEMERFLSSPFIRDTRYGTRASTIVTVPYQGAARLLERRFGPNGRPLGQSDPVAMP